MHACHQYAVLIIKPTRRIHCPMLVVIIHDVTTSSTGAYQKHVIHYGTTHPFFTLVIVVQADYLLV